jgi:putative endonuclease
VRNDHIELGRLAEKAAARHLKRLGYRVLERNVRLAQGEIDIVASHEGAICLVEVRARLDDDPHAALESVGPAKRRKLATLGAAYAARRRLDPETPIRFDVAAVVFPEGDLKRPKITLVTDAISTDEIGRR